MNDRKHQTDFFSVIHSNGNHGPRVGYLSTCHGASETPCFLPIASHGSLRALSFEQAAECGTRVIMANAWHIYRNAGSDLLHEVGGVHRLVNWDGAMFTDSGGYQVFSMRDSSEITDDGVSFDREGDYLTPERVIEIQRCLGSDVMTVLDDCPPYPCSRKRAKLGLRRTSLWAQRCMKAYNDLPRCYDHSQHLYGITQGGEYEGLRKNSIEEVAQLGFGGYGIGGLSIGMPRSLIRELTVLTCENLPSDRPRHLLGVGLPGQILEGVADGVDTFDCVLPIRKAQRGVAHTSLGVVIYKRPQRNGLSDLPLDPNCDCTTCQQYSREQLRLLYRSDKPLAGQLAAIHNIYFYHKVLARAREAIRENRFSSYINEFLSKWQLDGAP